MLNKIIIWVGGIILTIAVLFGVNFGGRLLGLWQYSFFAPKYENARREVFENTQSYVEGKRQSLTKHYNEYRKADTSDKEALRMIVLQEFANFNINQLTPQQQQWYIEMTK